MPVFFDNSRYLTEQYFDIVWGYSTHPPGTSHMDPPKIKILNGLILGASFLDIDRYLTDKYFDIVCWYPRRPQMVPPKINFLKGLS